MLSWCSPSAVLQSASVSGGELIHASGTPVFTSGALAFVAAAQAMTLIVWLWCPVGLTFQVPCDGNNQTVLTQHGQQTNTRPVFL